MSFHDCAVLKESSFGAVRTTEPKRYHEHLISTDSIQTAVYRIFCAIPTDEMVAGPQETSNSTRTTILSALI